MMIDLAEALKNELNTHTFTLDFTAERTAMPDLSPQDCEELKVLVVASAHDIEPHTRANDRHDMTIDVAVIKRLGDTTNSSVDPLVNLVDELAAYLKRLRVNSRSPLSVSNRPLYDYARLKERSLFLSVLHVTYRAFDG